MFGTEDELLGEIEDLKRTISIQEELLKVYESQVVDLSIMSKIELGDDVIEKIKELKDKLKC
jgi:hypothetical protein